MAENYDLIFGQSASSQYAWSDGDYQNGWQTVGSTPPTAEQFDALQRKSDTKAKDLNDRLSPLEEKAEADGRQAATSYTSGAMLTVDGLPNGWLLECIAPGISGTDAITLPDTLIDGLTIIDGTVTWKLRKVATNGGIGYRQPSTAYAVGNIAYHASLPTGWCLKCATAGMSGTDAIDFSSSKVGDTITDGGVTWTVVKYALTTDVPPLASALATPRKIELTGNVTGSANFDGSKGIQIATSLANVSALAHSLLSKTTAADMRGVIEANAQNCGGIVAESLTSPGYVKFANGFIIEWGSVRVDSPGAGGYPDKYKKYWGYPIKMSAPLGAVAIDMGANVADPQPLCIWALEVDILIVNCPIVRTAFILAIGIA